MFVYFVWVCMVWDSVGGCRGWVAVRGVCDFIVIKRFWHLAKLFVSLTMLTNKVEFTQGLLLACQAIVQQWTLSHQELLQESDLSNALTMPHFVIFSNSFMLVFTSQPIETPSPSRACVNEIRLYPYSPSFWKYLPEVMLSNPLSL